MPEDSAGPHPGGPDRAMSRFELFSSECLSPGYSKENVSLGWFTAVRQSPQDLEGTENQAIVAAVI
jgi:hypothetical protein